MLKHRQDGLVFLHGLFLDVLVVALFLSQVSLFRWTGWIEFHSAVNWSVYLVGVIVAMVWNHHALRGCAGHLGALGFSEAIRLTRQQLSRLGAVLFAVGFATQDVHISRGFIGCFLVVAGVVLLASNLAAPRLLAGFLFRSLRFRTLVAGEPVEARTLRGWLASRAYLGQTIVGCITAETREDSDSNPLWLGTVSDLRRVLEEENVNQVVINRRHFTPGQIAQILAEAERAACRVRYFIDLQEFFGEAMPVVECHERYAFAAESTEPLDNPVNGLVKRTMDLIVAVPIVIFVLPPLTLFVWIMQRLQSPGPVLYRQERSGLNRQRFHIFKFRTMHVANAEVARQATRNDSRVYPFGRFLRKTSLDEFPQFINVLLGEMSVSGPRPHLIEHDRQFAELVGSYYKRHFVKPGITGLAQSEGFRGEVMGQPELLMQRIHRDLRYVNMWSLELDLRIMAATARQVVRPPRAAY